MFKSVSFRVISALLLASLSQNAQTVVFHSGFEYDFEPIVGLDAANLNGATDQIGLF